MNRRDVAIVVILFIVAAVPRVLDLGTFLTADEKNWMGRSYEFIRAIKDGRFNDTLQTTHPGVTVLWVSGVAMAARILLTDTLFSFENLAHFVTAAQLPIALLNSLAVPAIYILLRRLLATKFVPLLASLFIALDPWLIGYSRVVHVDALLASFMILAALATIIHVQSGYKRRWLTLAAVLSGLAILTKAPAVFLLPFMVLVWLVENGFRVHKVWLRNRARDLGVWLGIVGVMFVTLWPAMLFVPDPKGNALLIKRDLVIAGVTPHNMVEEYTLNSSHYVFTLLTRTTPLTLVFAGGVVAWMLLKSTIFKTQSPNKAQFSNDQNTKTIWLLLGYVFFFVVMMTFVAKKGDRYIMPVFPALDILAAFGIWGLARLRLQYIVGCLSVVYLIATVWNYHPYAIAYSNPLFRDNLSQELGWGEGLEQVAAWLDEHGMSAVVASWYPEELGAYTSARVAHINAHEQGKVRYIVLYRNMFGRSPDHYANNFIDEYYKKRDPVFVAEVAGKEFAWVYEKWVFDRTVDELLPGKTVSQRVNVAYKDLVGFDVMVATYSGKAKQGTLFATLRQAQGKRIQEWRVPVDTIEDDRWLTLRLPQSVDIAGQNVDVEISAEGTAPGNAPTVRSNSDRLAVRLRYALASGQEATEEDTRLLKAAE